MKNKIIKLYQTSPLESLQRVGIALLPGAPIILLGSLFTGTFILTVLALITFIGAHVGLSVYATKPISQEVMTTEPEQSSESQPNSNQA